MSIRADKFKFEHPDFGVDVLFAVNTAPDLEKLVAAGIAFDQLGSYELPYKIGIAGTLVSNSGYPYISTYSLSRATAAAAGINLTRATQTVLLSNRGDERLPSVTLIDLRLSRSFTFGNRRIQPQLDIYNLTNQYSAQSTTVGVGTTYLRPTSILSPRIMRVGVALNF